MLVMQANGMVSHSAPPTATGDPTRSGVLAPLCIPVVGKVQLSSRLQQLLQKSNELDRLQALQQRAALGAAGDRRRGPYDRPRPANGQLRQRQPATGGAPHTVSAAGDGLSFRVGQDAPPPPLVAGGHQKILPKPVPLSAAGHEPPLSFKVDKVKVKHKPAKTAVRSRPESSVQKPKARAVGKVKAADQRAVLRPCPTEPPVAAPRPAGVPTPLRAYHQASLAECGPYRPLLVSAVTSSESDDEADGAVAALAVRRHRERRRLSRCARLLLAELRRTEGEPVARLCRRLLRPPAAPTAPTAPAADHDRRRRLLVRQRLEARRLLAALEEARERRCQLAERVRLSRPLLAAADSQPGRTAELLMRHDPAARAQPGHNRSRLTQLVRRSCCHHKGTNVACSLPALPCTRHCARHILYNVDQLLFQHCTAKFSDNTQCCAPVFDVKHELPLCEEHARKRDNYEKMAEKTKSEPKKKSRSIKRPKRRKKVKRKILPRESTPTDTLHEPSSLDGSFGDMDGDLDDEDEEEDEDDLDESEEEEEDAAVARSAPELDRSLELHLGGVLENEFSEVLSKLPDEAFTELFSDTHAGDLVHEETEELERALEAVERESGVQASGGGGGSCSSGGGGGAGGGGGGDCHRSSVGVAGELAAAAAARPEPAPAVVEPAAPVARQHVLNGNPSLASAEMEENVYSQLAQGISLEHAISSVLNGQEMNTLNQLLNHLGDSVIQDADGATISAS